MALIILIHQVSYLELPSPVISAAQNPWIIVPVLFQFALARWHRAILRIFSKHIAVSFGLMFGCWILYSSLKIKISRNSNLMGSNYLLRELVGCCWHGGSRTDVPAHRRSASSPLTPASVFSGSVQAHRKNLSARSSNLGFPGALLPQNLWGSTPRTPPPSARTPGVWTLLPWTPGRFTILASESKLRTDFPIKKMLQVRSSLCIPAGAIKYELTGILYTGLTTHLRLIISLLLSGTLPKRKPAKWRTLET